MAKIYDPLGLAAPTTLQGKLLYCEARGEKRAWDAPLYAELEQQWKKWERSLPQQINCPRALTRAQQPSKNIQLHAFGDASGKGVAAAVYAVIKQPSSVNQGLVTAKARLAKQGLPIPCRELTSGHMAVNLLSNVQDVLEGFPVSSLHCWLVSSVPLHWICGNGDFKQFVANRVRKIREHGDISWRHVPTIILQTLLAVVDRSQKRNCGGRDQHGSKILEHGSQTLLLYPPQNPTQKSK